MDLAAIRTGIKTVIEANLADFTVYTVANAVVRPPAVVVTTTDPFVTYHVANANGLALVNFELTVLVPLQDERRAQDAMDALISSGPGSDRSVIDALATDSTLDGSAETCLVVSASSYGTSDLGDAVVGSATLALTVYASRK